MYDFEDNDNPCDFREVGNGSALRAGILKHDCPTCGDEKVLTDADKARGYQCDNCADQAERGW